MSGTVDGSEIPNNQPTTVWMVLKKPETVNFWGHFFPYWLAGFLPSTVSKLSRFSLLGAQWEIFLWDFLSYVPPRKKLRNYTP